MVNVIFGDIRWEENDPICHLVGVHGASHHVSSFRLGISARKMFFLILYPE